MYRVKENTKIDTELRFRPYAPLSAEGQTPEARVDAIRSLIKNGRPEEAIEETAVLIQLALEGLRYLQTYDWLFLRVLITVGYLGWMAYAVTNVIDLHVLQGSTQPQRSLGGVLFFSSVLVALWASFIVSKSPVTYYAYAFFPVLFWEEVFARRESLAKGRQALFGHVTSGARVLTLVINSVLYLGVIESLVSAHQT